jgi:hypothetical protein
MRSNNGVLATPPTAFTASKEGEELPEVKTDDAAGEALFGAFGS